MWDSDCESPRSYPRGSRVHRPAPTTNSVITLLSSDEISRGCARRPFVANALLFGGLRGPAKILRSSILLGAALGRSTDAARTRAALPIGFAVVRRQHRTAGRSGITLQSAAADRRTRVRSRPMLARPDAAGIPRPPSLAERMFVTIRGVPFEPAAIGFGLKSDHPRYTEASVGPPGPAGLTTSGPITIAARLFPTARRNQGRRPPSYDASSADRFPLVRANAAARVDHGHVPL